MNKSILVIAILAVAIIILAVILFLPKDMLTPGQQNSAGGITVSLPVANQVITSPLKITGTVNGDGWIGFEAQVGTVKLLDDAGNVLGFGILTAQGEWMQQVINFETTLTFKPTTKDSGSLVFYNENPSGEAERNKTFILPVKFK